MDDKGQNIERRFAWMKKWWLVLTGTCVMLISLVSVAFAITPNSKKADPKQHTVATLADALSGVETA
jgi:hypothetical protein